MLLEIAKMQGRSKISVVEKGMSARSLVRLGFERRRDLKVVDEVDSLLVTVI